MRTVVTFVLFKRHLQNTYQVPGTYYVLGLNKYSHLVLITTPLNRHYYFLLFIDEKTRHREVTKLAQGHTANKLQSCRAGIQI